MSMKKGDELLKDLFDITGKVALVTGATGGFGSTISMALAMVGAKVMATGRSEDKLKSLVEEIKNEGRSRSARPTGRSSSSAVTSYTHLVWKLRPYMKVVGPGWWSESLCEKSCD